MQTAAVVMVLHGVLGGLVVDPASPGWERSWNRLVRGHVVANDNFSVPVHRFHPCNVGADGFPADTHFSKMIWEGSDCVLLVETSKANGREQFVVAVHQLVPTVLVLPIATFNAA